MGTSDSDLIAAALDGDVDAFGILYERHWRLVVGIALGICSDRHLAEDVAQEAFATAASRLANLRERKRFPQWLSTICRRTASRLNRRHPPLIALQIDPPDEEPSVSSRAEAIKSAMMKLDDATRELLALRYFSDLSHAQIAATLETTPASVHGRLQRARRKLTQAMEREQLTGDSNVRD